MVPKLHPKVKNRHCEKPLFWICRNCNEIGALWKNVNLQTNVQRNRPKLAINVAYVLKILIKTRFPTISYVSMTFSARNRRYIRDESENYLRHFDKYYGMGKLQTRTRLDPIRQFIAFKELVFDWFWHSEHHPCACRFLFKKCDKCT